MARNQDQLFITPSTNSESRIVEPAAATPIAAATCTITTPPIETRKVILVLAGGGRVHYYHDSGNYSWLDPLLSL